MSALRGHVAAYLSLRRALGYRLEREGWLLPQFVAFVEQQHGSHITTAGALDWATRRADASPYWAAKRLGMVRQFAIYMSARDPRTEVPALDLLRARRSRCSPYLYRDTDIRALLEACTRLRAPLVRATYTTLFGLLAVTGMRVGEAIALDGADVDARRGV